MYKRLFTLAILLIVLAVPVAQTAGARMGRPAAQDSPGQSLLVTPPLDEESTPAGAEATLALATTRVSVSSSGVEGNGESNLSDLSNNGDFVAFESFASNLVADDTNGERDVFVHNRQTGLTERVSVSSTGQQGNGESWGPEISYSGRYVVFCSRASNLVSGDTNGVSDIFVIDRDTDIIQRVSVSSSEAQATGESNDAAISDNGRYIAFYSSAGNLVSGDTNAKFDVFLRDTVAGETWRVSISTEGTQGNDNSWGEVSISGDGRRVGFSSWASTLVPNDTNGTMDAFVRDWFNGWTRAVSISSSGALGNATSTTGAISNNGQYVGFGSEATNLVAGDTNGVSDAFVHNLETGVTERASVSSSGQQANSGAGAVEISSGGRLVMFHSWADNLVTGDNNGYQDIFVHDRVTHRTNRVSIATSGAQGDDNAMYLFDMSGDTRFVSFSSYASNLVANDSNGVLDVFVREFRSCYALTLQKQSGDGSVPVATPGKSIGCEPGTYQPGEFIVLDADPADGWHVAGWSGTDNDGSTQLTNAVTMPNNDHTARVTYAVDCYTLTRNVSPSGGGTITPSPLKSSSCPANDQYTAGTSVSLQATHNSGYQFSNWSGALSGAANPQAVIMDGNKSVTANFVLMCYTLTLNRLPSNGGYITAEPLKSADCPVTYQYTPGTNVLLTAKPNTGYQFDGWSSALTGTPNPQSLVMNGSNTVNAHFSQSSAGCYQLLLDHTGTGSDPTASLQQSAGCSANFYRSDTVIELTADPANGWHVANWTGTNNDSSTSLTNSVTMPARQHTVRVTYAQNSPTARRALLPAVVNVPLTCWSGPEESDHNDDMTQATGPLCSGQVYSARDDDKFDYYFLDAAAGEIAIDMTNHGYPKVQLLLYYQRASGPPVESDTSPEGGWNIRYNGPAGRYYVIVYSDAASFSTTVYTLQANFATTD